MAAIQILLLVVSIVCTIHVLEMVIGHKKWLRETVKYLEEKFGPDPTHEDVAEQFRRERVVPWILAGAAAWTMLLALIRVT